MGKCVLSIELEDPAAAYRAGQKVRGQVQVDADADVRCRSLTVYAGWRTRGMGNVASEQGPKVTLFSGELTAGASQRFSFEVETLLWPVTYNGFQLSVEHFVEATADIPWTVDPKVSLPIHVTPGDYRPPDAEPPRSPAALLQLILFLFLSLFLTFIALSFFGPNPIVMIGIPVLLLCGAGLLMLIFKWLPKLYVGQVHFDLEPRRLSPGELLRGSFSLRPTSAIEPQFIRFRLIATEVCVSGTGTNQKTHRHVLFDRLLVLAEQPQLPANETKRYEILTRLPRVAAYSLKLTHNELHWVAQIHIGIPGLVDWKDEIYLSVVPSLDPAMAARTLAPGHQAAQFALDLADLDVADSAPPEDAITFAETVGHIVNARANPEQVDLLVDAVAGLPLPLQVRIGRRLLRGGDEDVQLAPDEQVVWAEHEEPLLPLSLYIPKHRVEDFERASGTIWEGRGEIVGWDRRGGRLQVRIEG